MKSPLQADALHECSALRTAIAICPGDLAVFGGFGDARHSRHQVLHIWPEFGAGGLRPAIGLLSQENDDVLVVAVCPQATASFGISCLVVAQGPAGPIVGWVNPRWLRRLA